MISRIKAIVAAGLGVSLHRFDEKAAGMVVSKLGVLSASWLVVDIHDSARGCKTVATECDWQHGGDEDATLEAAVSKAEAYLARKADETKGEA